VRITICGHLRVEADGSAVEEESLPGRLGRRLWVYLVLNRRRPIGRGELESALWGEDAPDAADASLNALASRLRSTIGRVAPGLELRASGGSYSLGLPSDVFVDRERAWSAIHHVQALRRQGDHADAWAEAVIASEIAARGLLPGEDAAWIEAERRTLRDIELQALEAIGGAEIERNRADEAERVGRRLIVADPLRESGYRLLMRAAAAGGDSAHAAGVMRECRAVLGAAGLAPSAETEAVYREALRPRAPGSKERP
jgi:DNA-binding SARP family transcriptional activator